MKRLLLCSSVVSLPARGRLKFGVFLPTLVLSGLTVATAQHSHINAGAFDTSQNAQLYFVNGDTYASESGFVVSLNYTNEGRFAGFYQGALSFTALAATPNNGGPAFGHAALGSVIELEIQSVSGPKGGSFGFWDEGDTAPRIVLKTGTEQGTNRFTLSESDGSPGEDPYGHIHGRGFTATKPGLYEVGFRLVDTSHNGAAGGPIHAPSETFRLLFQADVTIAVWEVAADRVAITFGTSTGSSYYLERAEGAGVLEWMEVAGPLAGDSHLRTLMDLDLSPPQAIYRVRRSTP